MNYILSVKNRQLELIFQISSLRDLFNKKILKNSDFSPLNTYTKLFEMFQVQFEFTDDFIEYIADLAIAKKSGARSLKTVFDDCISSALFRIFAGEYSGISLVKPDIENERPYVLTKTKEKKDSLKENN